jgi:hypothetical protein
MEFDLAGDEEELLVALMSPQCAFEREAVAPDVWVAAQEGCSGCT